MMSVLHIIRRVKDICIPSERNGMVPYALGETGFALSLVFALLLVLSPSYFSLSQLASLTEPFSLQVERVIQLVNNARAGAGLGALSENKSLDIAASKKVRDMLSEQYFAHISPNGTTPWDFFKQAGYYPYSAAGENLASDFLTAEDAQRAFMESPTHRANILQPLYTEIGVAVQQGTLHGQPTILIAQYFGKPRTSLGRATPKPTPSAPARPASPQPVASAPAPTTLPKAAGEVLGTQTVPNSPVPAPKEQTLLERAQSLIAYIKSHVSPTVGFQLAAFAGIFVLLLAIAFFITRTGSVPVEIGFRTALVLLLLAYATTGGAHPLSYAEITPSAVTDFQLTTNN